MTQQKNFKRAVRARMRKTGESYSSARASHLSSSREAVPRTATGSVHPQLELLGSDDKPILSVGHALSGSTRRLALANSQVAFVDWFGRQLSALANGGSARTALLVGDRRGGKTWAGVMCMLAAALERPGVRTYVISAPEERQEIKRIFETYLPASWVEVTEGTNPVFALKNGSYVVNVTPRSLAKLEVEGLCLFVNDYSKLTEKQVDALLNAAGLSVIAGNAPDQDSDEWFSKYRSQLKANAMDGFHIRPEDNPFINQAAYQKYLRLSAVVRPRTAAADSRFWAELPDRAGIGEGHESSGRVIHSVKLDHAGAHMSDGTPISYPTNESLCGAPMASMVSGALSATAVTCPVCKELLGIGTDRGGEVASPRYEQFLNAVSEISLRHTISLINSGLPPLEMMGKPAEIMASALQLSEDEVEALVGTQNAVQQAAMEFVRRWFATMPHWLDPEVAWKRSPLSQHRCFLAIVRTAALANACLQHRLNVSNAERFAEQRVAAAKRLAPSYATFAGHDDAFMAATDFVEHWPNPGLDAPTWLLKAMRSLPGH